MNKQRLLIDPEGRYPCERFSAVEANALRIVKLFNGARVARSRDAIQIDPPSDWQIVVLVTAEALELRFKDIELRPDPYPPIESSTLWKRLLWRELATTNLIIVLKEADGEANRRLKTCPRCQRSMPRGAFGPRRKICESCRGNWKENA